MLVTLEALSFAVFAVFVLPRLPHHRVQSILAICLGSLAFVQHYRYEEVQHLISEDTQDLVLFACLSGEITSWCVQGGSDESRVPADHDRSRGDGIAQPALQYGSV